MDVSMAVVSRRLCPDELDGVKNRSETLYPAAFFKDALQGVCVHAFRE